MEEWDDGTEIEGPDGRTRTRMILQGMRFEVSWDAAKADRVRRKGIELRQAVRVLDDPDVALELQENPPYRGQYRAVGLTSTGRLLTVALEIEYPDDDEYGDDVGIIRVYTAWEPSSAERAFYHS